MAKKPFPLYFRADGLMLQLSSPRTFRIYMYYTTTNTDGTKFWEAYSSSQDYPPHVVARILRGGAYKPTTAKQYEEIRRKYLAHHGIKV